MAILLLTTPVLVEALGPDIFGVFVTITALTSYLAMSDLGIGAGLLTVLGGSAGRGDQREMARLVTSAAWLLLFAGTTVLVLGLTLSFAGFIPPLLGAPPEYRVQANLAFQIFVVGFALGMPLTLGARVQTSLQQGAEAAAWLSFNTGLSAVAAASTAVATGSLVMTMAVSVGTTAILGLAQFIRVVRQHRWIFAYGFNFHRSTSRGLLSSSSLLFVLQITAVIAFQSDILIVASLLGAEQAAVFHGVLRAFAIVSLVTTALASQFWPATAEAFSKGDFGWVRRQHRQLAWQLPALAGAASATLVLFGRPLIGWWLGEALTPPLSLLVAFAGWTTYISFVLPYTQVLNATGVLWAQVAFSIPMVALNLALSIYLTSTIGLAGTTLGSLVAHFLVALVPTIVIVKRTLNVRGS